MKTKTRTPFLLPQGILQGILHQSRDQYTAAAAWLPLGRSALGADGGVGQEICAWLGGGLQPSSSKGCGGLERCDFPRKLAKNGVGLCEVWLRGEVVLIVATGCSRYAPAGLTHCVVLSCVRSSTSGFFTRRKKENAYIDQTWPPGEGGMGNLGKGVNNMQNAKN